MNNSSVKRFSLVVITLFFLSIIAPISIRAEGISYSDKGYSLKQVVILSRHNIRAPLSTEGSTLYKVTPHNWFDWSSGASELSLRGGILETEMGQYFRKWLESESLISENYHPKGQEVRFYSNSKQRTIATAKYFSAGFIPTANVDIEYHMDFDKTDPVFAPVINFSGNEYINDATAQVIDIFGDSIKSLSDNYELIADVIDMEKSEDYNSYSFSDDILLKYNVGDEPTVEGSLKLGTQISDALVLQYYEESDPQKAAFGKDLSLEDWKRISEVKDVYGDVLFTAPIVAVNVANPLIKEIYSEMHTDGRLFTFLCGHDANIGSVLAALGVKDYELPNSIEKKTPIGCKLVFSKWENGKGKVFWSVDLVYQSTDQLKEQPILDLENAPVIYHLSFNGIKQNRDGLYKAKDVKKLFKNSMKEYNSLQKKYSDTVS